MWTDTTAIGYGQPGGGDQLALKLRPDAEVVHGRGFHLAFSAPSLAAVVRFHEAAIRHGGTDDGRPGPGPGPHYGLGYYAAFVLDPGGHRIEAVIKSLDPCA